MSRHRWAGALIAVLALVACSGSSKSNQTTATGSGAPGGTLVLGSDGSSSTASAPESTTTTAPSGCQPGDGCATGNGGDTSSDAGAKGAPGSFAPDILQPSRSSEVLVELLTQSSADPQQPSMDHLVAVLRDVTGKSVSVAGGPGVAGGAKSWSADDLRSAADTGAAQGNGRAVIHLLFVHGSFGGDTRVLGISVRGDVAAVFIDQVNASSTPLVGSAGIEAAVVTHEVGHLMGLVDLFLHTGRQDAAHPGHSTNPNSVMYWAVESNLVADLLQGGPPKDFDSADLADLQTIRDSG